MLAQSSLARQLPEASLHSLRFRTAVRTKACQTVRKLMSQGALPEALALLSLGNPPNCSETRSLFLFFFLRFIFLFIYDSHRERGRDTGRGRSRLHAPGAGRGIRSRVSRIAPWAKGRRQTAAPTRDPLKDFLKAFSKPETD